MTAAEIAEVRAMALSTVSAVLARIGLGKRSRLDPPEPPNRYERRRPADRLHSRGVELGDRPGQERVRHRSDVVEAHGAFDRHAVGRTDLDLGFNSANRPRHERDEDIPQPGQRLIARQHDDRPATFICEF
jgi:hypothetical protein